MSNPETYKCPFCGGVPTVDHNCTGLQEATKKYASPEYLAERKRIAEFSKSHMATVEDGKITIKGKVGRVYSLTPKGKQAFEVWNKHLKEIEKELASSSKNPITEPTK